MTGFVLGIQFAMDRFWPIREAYSALDPRDTP